MPLSISIHFNNRFSIYFIAAKERIKLLTTFKSKRRIILYTIIEYDIRFWRNWFRFFLRLSLLFLLIFSLWFLCLLIIFFSYILLLRFSCLYCWQMFIISFSFLNLSLLFFLRLYLCLLFFLNYYLCFFLLLFLYLSLLLLLCFNLSL